MRDYIVQGQLGANNFLSVLLALLQSNKLNIKNI